jgi:hypothetical protein
MMFYDARFKRADTSSHPNTHIFISMALYRVPTSPSPTPASQSQESFVPAVGSGSSYQPHIYIPHPHGYAHADPHYYNGQSRPYSYGVQHTAQAPPALPLATPPPSTSLSKPAVKQPPEPLPNITSEETKPGRNSKTAARRPRTHTRKGRASGSQNWSTQDLIALAHYVEEAVPFGMNVWKRIEGLYNKDYAIPNNRQERTWDNMQDKWYKVSFTDTNAHCTTLTSCFHRS